MNGHSPLTPTPRRHLRTTPFRPLLEVLEERCLLTYDWTSIGPSPIINGQAEGLTNQSNPVIGAVQAVAPDPSNADILYAGTVNGGIWKTTNATAAFPTWMPLTDNLPSLAIGDIALSPLDPTHQTIFASTGNYTNGGFNIGDSNPGGYSQPGGQAVGIYESTDGGKDWQVINPNGIFTNLSIHSIVPSKYAPGAEQVVLAGTMTDPRNQATDKNDGLYESLDGGMTWARISGPKHGLPDGSIGDIVEDPLTPSTFYATVSGTDATNGGVYVSVDGGSNWTQINGGSGGAIASSELKGGGYYRLAAQNNNGTTQLFFGIVPFSGPSTESSSGGYPVGDEQTLSDVYTSNNGGQTWTSIGIPEYTDSTGTYTVQSGAQGMVNFSMVADPNHPGYLYIGGDTVNETGDIKHTDYTGVEARWDGSKWEFFLGNINTKGTSPHADSRNMVFDKNGDIIETDDGGIYRLFNPSGLDSGVTTQWQSVIGTGLADSEVYSVAYDHINHVAFIGNQDTGSSTETLQGSTVWNEVIKGDGAAAGAAANNDTTGTSIHYQTGDSFDLQVLTYNSYGQLLSNTEADENGIPSSEAASISAYAVNAYNGDDLLVGGMSYTDSSGNMVNGGIYFSSDSGNNFKKVGSVFSSSATAVAYGAARNGKETDQVGAVATADGYIYLGFIDPSSPSSTSLGTYMYPDGGAEINSLAFDPNDYANIYLVDQNGVFMTSNAFTGSGTGTPNSSASFTNITGNLAGDFPVAVTVANIHDHSKTYTVVLVSARDGIYATLNPGLGQWFKLGDGLPNVVTDSLVYDSTDDVLVAGTYGRGVWVLHDASKAILAHTVGVTLDTTATDPTNQNPIPMMATFTQAVTGLTAADIAATGATVGNVTAVNPDANGYATSWTFNLTPSAAQGPIDVHIGEGVVTDESGVANMASNHFTITFDSLTPTVTLSSTATSPTSLSPIPVTATFDQAVQGLTSAGIQATNATVSNVLPASGFNTVYTFDLSPLGPGTVTATVMADAAENNVGTGNSASAPFVINFNSTPPGVAIYSTAANPTDRSPIRVTARFTQPVIGLTINGITTSNATVGNVTAVDPDAMGFADTWTFDLTPLGPGPVTASVNAGAVTDSASNPNTASNNFTITYTTSEPSVTLSSTDTNPTSQVPITVTAMFSQPVTGLTATGIGTVNASVGTVTAVNPVGGYATTWTIGLHPTVATGTVSAYVSYHAAHNSGGAGNSASSLFTIDFNNTAPGVSLDATATDPTADNPIQVTATFTQPVSGLSEAGITVLNARVSSVTPIDTIDGLATVWKFLLTPTIVQGTITVQINAGAAQSATGISNTQSALFTVEYAATNAGFDELGAYRPSDGSWSLDSNGQFGFQTGPVAGPSPLADRILLGFLPPGVNTASVTPVSGDWAHLSTTEIGDFVNGTWYLDLNNNGVVDSGETFIFGTTGDVPVPGDYFTPGDECLAVFRGLPNGSGEFIISDKNWLQEAQAGQSIGVSLTFIYGAANDHVVVGDWNGKGLTEVGVYRPATAFGAPNAYVWTLDIANHRAFDSTNKVFIFGAVGDGVVIGDWNGSGTSKVGTYRAATAFGAPNTAVFSLDETGDFMFDSTSRVFLYGTPTDEFVTGRWAYTTSSAGAAIPAGGSDGADLAAALLTAPTRSNPTALDAYFSST